FSDFPNARFRVDGVMYIGGVDFLWPQGSKHFIDAVEAQDSGAEWGVLYGYTGWGDNLGGSGTGPVTADAALKWVKVGFLKKYLLTVSVSPDCPLGTACPAPGRVEETPCGVVINQTVSCFVQAGVVGRFAAYPGTGAIFTRWMSTRDLS